MLLKLILVAALKQYLQLIPDIQNKDKNLSIIYVSDSPFTIQRGLITKNNYNQNSDAFRDVREYEISEGTFIGAV